MSKGCFRVERGELRSASDPAGTATARANRFATGHDRGAHRLVADPQFGRDLFERHALLVQPRSIPGSSKPRRRTDGLSRHPASGGEGHTVIVPDHGNPATRIARVGVPPPWNAS